ncbi:MAG: hypothetical protein JKY54_12950 [Flavobacteriales bacterium]|nr:hypothetical protein [Flavobacteriales bacterium]
MDIQRFSQLLQAVRPSKISRTPNTSIKTPKTTKTATAGKLDQEALKKLIVKRLDSIDQNKGNPAQLARKIFVETALIWEFGEDILHDEQFSLLVQQVESSMSGNPTLDKEFALMLNEITRS